MLVLNMDVPKLVIGNIVQKNGRLLQLRYNKTPHKRTGIWGVQADFVLIHGVFSAKLA